MDRTRELWLIILLNAFNDRKIIPEVTGGGRYFLGNSERVRELTLACENGRSGGVGGNNYNSPRGGGLHIF